MTDDRVDRLAALLLQCLQVGHRWILSPDIAAAYHHQFDKHIRERDSMSTKLTRSLKDINRDSNASLYLSADDLKPVSGNYDPNDHHMVEAAAAVRGSTLITLDRRLIADLEKEGIPNQYGFEVWDVELAAQRLIRRGPADPAALPPAPLT